MDRAIDMIIMAGIVIAVFCLHEIIGHHTHRAPDAAAIVSGTVR